MRLTRLEVCMTQACLIFEPVHPLADHAAFSNQPVVKGAKHLSSSPWSRHQQGRETVWVPTTRSSMTDPVG